MLVIRITRNKIVLGKLKIKFKSNVIGDSKNKLDSVVKSKNDNKKIIKRMSKMYDR